MRRRLLLSLGVAAAAVVVLAAGLRGSAPGVPTFRVTRSGLVREVTAHGELEAVDSTTLSAPRASRPLTVAWLVEDGTPVKAGDVVARFDPTEIEKEVEDARTEVARLTAQIEAEEAGRRAASVRLREDARVAEKEERWATTYQATDTELYSLHERITSATDAELAGARRRHARGVLSVEERLATTRQELLRISLAAARTRLERAQKDLAHLELTAPHDGIALVARDWRGTPVRTGDRVWPGRPLVLLPDLGRMQAVVYVLEADAGGLEPGRPADVTITAHPGTSYRASVQHVDPVAQPRVEDSPVQFFRTVLGLERTVPGVMKPGARVMARIQLSRVEDAVVVPLAAVMEREGRPVVYRRAGRRFEPLAVKLGPAARGRVVIEEGVAEGDEIALVDPTARTHATPTPGAAAPVAGGAG